MLFDLPLERLREHSPELTLPADFESFWGDTLARARELPLDVEREEVALGFPGLRVFDVSFAGFGGDRIRAWLRLPTHSANEPLPGFVEFHGYRGGRGLPHEPRLWPQAGFAHLAVDTRGQGGAWTAGATPDPHGGTGPETAGWVTRGISSPATYYYRRVFVDAVRAVEAMRSIPDVETSRVFAGGVSQGGGIALAAAGLLGDLAGVVTDVPFLCDFPEALALTSDYSSGYGEVLQYLMVNREQERTVLDTLSYFDVANLVTLAEAPALFSVALADSVCAPRTVFAAFNRYRGSDKEIAVYPYNGHEGGGAHQAWRALEWVRARCAA
ncbi:acetylxylan esterase [Herbiconiux sp. KACC 21604]|uniref:acetylxylan esterase n=1 Tax=unclassified Herbiconiux TaxID=2618217 RepID=UPI00149092FC|nr:acetylxylan esterase [Herbiconiux sp. SALV-R1]QJU52576.1 prolyl oligopeptidase family serine peptidase [Herbiconiux sp. SALV-R1]WPO87459.1 acetylxylan esterase [Herbiconiux sp. KACC 21604]